MEKILENYFFKTWVACSATHSYMVDPPLTMNKIYNRENDKTFYKN